MRPAEAGAMDVEQRRGGVAVGRLRRRVPACVIDWSLALMVGVLVSLPGGVVAGATSAGSVAYAAGYAACLLGLVGGLPGYWLACWRWLDRRSVGQRLLGLRVLRSGGQRPSAARMVGREIALKWIAHALTFGLWLAVGAVVARCDPARRALHDRVGDTVVVRECCPERALLGGLAVSDGPRR
ncbi:MAG: RDD family protein [Solirubrobacteraceae bacterium MAG38_C4-C5]|nr:RDD family protein [Candidatus Siliceabacter maunaloa]